MSEHELTNWAGNLTYTAARFYQPSTVEDVQNWVAQDTKIRALGTRHSFNLIADTPHSLLSTTKLKAIEGIDVEAKTATIQPGVTYGELSPELEKNGLALHNLASLPHISVIGACVTATHGSGVTNQNLASQVRSFETVAPDGSLRTFSRDEDRNLFEGALVNLGGLGVAVNITLDLLPTFQVRQDVYQRLPLSTLESDFDAVLSGGYSVSLFYDWNGREINQVWVKSKVENDSDLSVRDEYFGAPRATEKLHPLPDISPENCTEQLGEPGPWHERLPHFKMEFTPSSGEELQSEFFVDRKDAFAAIQAVQTLGEEIYPNLFVTEIRTVAADSFWMSPQYQRESVGIHFTWKQYIPEVMALLPKIEEKLAPFQARPHWGKIFTISGQRIEELYPRIGDFRSLLTEFDPDGKFTNPFLISKIFPRGR